jgi:hypothetical protein
MKTALLIAVAALLGLLGAPALAQAELGRLSANPHAPGSTANPASRFHPNSVTNPYGRYGSPHDPASAANPYATDAPKLFDDAGRYRGRLSANPYDPDSIANPHGRYGSRYSPDSVNNPHGAGNPFAPDSPTNPHGRGLRIIGRD